MLILFIKVMLINISAYPNFNVPWLEDKDCNFYEAGSVM